MPENLLTPTKSLKELGKESKKLKEWRGKKMKSEKELNDAFKALIELSDKEIEEVKNIIDEIIEYKIQDEETISHLFDRILSIVFIEDNEKREIFYKLSNYTRKINKDLANDYDEILEEDLNEEFVD